MPFSFDDQTRPQLEDGRQSVRFWMVDGDRRAACRIGYATLSEIGLGPVETGDEMLARFEQNRRPIAEAASRLLGNGQFAGEAVVQILRGHLR